MDDIVASSPVRSPMEMASPLSQVVHAATHEQRTRWAQRAAALREHGQAAAAGTPVIGCHTGGVPEAVGPGLVLDDPDAPDLSRVRALLRDPGAGATARRWVCEQHGPEPFVAAWEAVWEAARETP